MIAPFMRPEGPTQDEADALVKARKYIKELPRPKEGEREYKMVATVYSIATRQPVRLNLIATAKKAPSGIPSPIPSAALELEGRFRVRGINWALRHDCPSGPIVYGWHEHIWTTQHEDGVVIAARPAPRDTTMRGLFNWGLKKWNIEIGEPQSRNRIGKNKKARHR
jgi:hypothetical protein